MKDKYGVHRGAHKLDVVSINDDSIRFVMQRSGASGSNNNSREVRNRSADELDDIFGEPVFNQLQRSTR